MKIDVRGLLLALTLVGAAVTFLKWLDPDSGYALPDYRPEQTDWR